MRKLIIGGLVVVLIGAAVFALAGGRPYRASVSLASATNVVEGGPIEVNGFEAGTVRTLEVRDGQAFVDLDIDESVAPLHEGAVVYIAWKAVLSERRVQIIDGPETNAELPSGIVLPSTMPKPTEVDHVLNALDEETRAELTAFVQSLDTTLKGSEQDIKATLASAGPALGSLGSVLQAVGTDGPAIKALITRLNGMLTTLASREQNVRTVVEELGRMSAATSQRTTELSATLDALPPTLRQAEKTLRKVPEAVDEVQPLLDDLREPSEKLPSFASDLRAVLKDLRPLADDLGPTLNGLSDLFDRTPRLFDDLTNLFPYAGESFRVLQQPVDYLRPYTPEAVGFLSNWDSAFSNYDSNGKYARILGKEGTTSFNESFVVPPGIAYDPYPLPGAVVDEPWADAFGSGIR